jgi:hypothetical protein
LAGFTTPVGWILVGIGVLAEVWKHLPWEIRRRPKAARKTAPPAEEPDTATRGWEELNELRVKRYEENRGLFLIHTWHPSRLEGQVADIEIRLCQHGEGPLSRGDVQAVEYTFGPKFTDHSRVSTEPANDFAVEESMYGPMLCLAKVYLAHGMAPLLLERYINFDGAKPSGSA